MFSHHPDGIVCVGETEFSFDAFVKLEPGYALPRGMAGREYLPGNRHTLYDADGNAHGGEMPWPEGNRYLENETGYRARMAVAEPGISLEEAKRLMTDRIKDLTGARLMRTDWQVIRHLGYQRLPKPAARTPLPFIRAPPPRRLAAALIGRLLPP